MATDPNGVASRQRFTRQRPCPVCHGYDNMERGHGVRCSGYLSHDGEYVYCTREEQAGRLQPNQNTQPPAYVHKRRGPCNCGVTHEHDTAAPAAKPKPPAKPIALHPIIYDYRDAEGNLAYQVVRTQLEHDKTFRQRRPDGRGGWQWKMDGVRRVLYRLPELLRADSSEPIFICEGEKDADNLTAGGMIATTNPGGAGSWRIVPDAAEILTGRHVVILEDNDEAGRNRTGVITAALDGKAASIRVLRLPNLDEHGDVSDWLQNGGTIALLRQLVNATPLWSASPNAPKDDGIWRPKVQSARELLSKTFAPTRWAVPGLFAEGLTILAAKPKCGKSTMTLHILSAVSYGGVALGKIHVEQGTALYLALEDNEQRMQRRLQQQLDTDDGATAPDALQLVYEWLPLDRGGIDALDRWMDEHPDTRVIAIDTLKKVRPSGNTKGNMYDLDYEALAPLQSWAVRRRIAVVVIHHLRKAPNESDPFDEISGSTGLQGVADNLMVMKKTNGIVTLYTKGRDIEENAIALKGDPESLLWTIEGNAEDVRLSQDQKAIYAVVEKNPGIKPAGMAVILGKKSNAVRQILHRVSMQAHCRLYKDEQGGYHLTPTTTNNTHNSSNGSNTHNTRNGSEHEPAVTQNEYSVTGVMGEDVTGVTGEEADSLELFGDALHSVTPVTGVTTIGRGRPCIVCGKPLVPHGDGAGYWPCNH